MLESVDIADKCAARKRLNDPIVIGKLGQPYGVKGWFRVVSFCSPQDNILAHRTWCLRRPSVAGNSGNSGIALSAQECAQFKVDKIKAHGKGFVASLVGLSDRDHAVALRNWEIVIEREDLPPLAEDDFYWYQLEGLTVQAISGENLGVLEQMLETGANDVMVVKPTRDSMDDRKRLIPYRYREVVKSVDLERKLVIVEWDLDF